MLRRELHLNGACAEHDVRVRDHVAAGIEDHSRPGAAASRQQSALFAAFDRRIALGLDLHDTRGDTRRESFESAGERARIGGAGDRRRLAGGNSRSWSRLRPAAVRQGREC
jgi:hypothetical protein